MSMRASVYGPFSDWHTATYVGRLWKPAVVGTCCIVSGGKSK
jgi:hypothetical protein